MFLAKITALVLISTLLISGCGTIIRDRTNDYQNAESGSDLRVPKHLAQQKVRARLPIPPVDSNTKITGEFSLPEPPDATAIIGSDPFTIDSVGDATWLQVYSAPGKLWPLLDVFWEESGVETAFENISKGILNTKPLGLSVKGRELATKLGMSELEAEKYSAQARLSQGIRRNTAEVQVRLIASGAEDSPWQEQASNPEYERKLLELIGEFVTSEEAANRHSLLANDIGGQAKVSLQTSEEGDKFILLNLSFERAWNTVNKSLRAAEVIVADKDRSQATYYISSLKPEDDDGWFSFLKSSEAPPVENNFAIKLISQPDESIRVTVELINKGLPLELADELLDVVLDHIS